MIYKSLEGFKREKNSEDCVMMIDKMYLQNEKQYQGGEYVGVEKQGQLYKGIAILYVVQTLPDVS